MSGIWDDQRRRLTIGLVLTITLVAFESLAVATVMPTVEADLGGRSLYGWVFSGFFLASLGGIAVTGILSDRRGPRLPFAAGLALFTIGLVIGGLAPSMPVLVLGRIAQGFGAGAIPASAYASVARAYPTALRPRVFAIFSTAWVVPGITGPSIATFVEEAATWHWVFLGLIPLVAVAAAIAIPAMGRLPLASVDTAPASGARDRLLRVAVLIVGVGLLLGALTADLSPLTVVLAAAGLGLAVPSFVALVPTGTLRLAPGLASVVAVRGLLTWSFFGIDAYVSLAVTEGRGGSTRLAGLVLSVTAVLWAGGSWVQERVVARLGPRTLDRLGFSLLTVASVSMLATVLWLPAWAAVPAWGLAGLGVGLAYAPLSVTALSTAAPGREGEATASLQLCDVLGTAIGTGIGGALIALADARDWDGTTGVALAFGAGTLMAVVGLAAAGRLPRAIPGLTAD